MNAKDGTDPLDDLAWDRETHNDFELREILERLSPALKARLRYWVNRRIDERNYIDDVVTKREAKSRSMSSGAVDPTARREIGDDNMKCKFIDQEDTQLHEFIITEYTIQPCIGDTVWLPGMDGVKVEERHVAYDDFNEYAIVVVVDNPNAAKMKGGVSNPNE